MPSSSQSQSQSSNSLEYLPSSGPGTNEVFHEDGTIREHWRYLLSSLQTLGPEALADRDQKARRILRDDGATYNIYDESTSPDRTWELDLVPALLSSEDWSLIESGLLERAELFNLILRDIYGPRNLIRTGVIPPEVIFCHKGFLRACHGLQLPGDQDLIVHASDLMRDENGKLCVMTDRTQSPSGMGYALENRTVMSRVLPSLFRDSQVHRLAVFFQRLRNKLNSLSQVDNPHVVVLTPGAHNETYFEHAYIANYLGLDLVQSGDLIVRNGLLWMKSLDGLNRVDVVLRRVDDWYCDPTELRSNSQLGVPNLLEVVRSGNVIIANPLGSGILESPALLKYLPEIAKALLGRELRLPSVDCFWAGNGSDLKYIEAHFDNLVIKPIFRGGGAKSIVTTDLSPRQRNDLLHLLRSRPFEYVAQPLLHASKVPCHENGQFISRPALLRTYAVATDTSYSLMPGGLTRAGGQRNAFAISSQTGAISKDTWVIASEPERKISLEDNVDSPTIASELISLPSRVVENLFWMGRYAERAEASLRVLRTAFVLMNGEESISDLAKRIILRTVTKVTSTEPGFLDAKDELIENAEQELLSVINDHQRTGTVRSNINAMLYCADESKEQLSSDTLRVINDIRDALSDLDKVLKRGAAAPDEALDPIVTALMALSGLAHESMVRGIGWRFMQMGKRLERGLLTATTIRELLVPEVSPSDQNTLIEAMLLSMETLISYRRRYRARMAVQTSLDIVLLDTTNPRSLLHQVDMLAKHIEKLPRSPDARHELTGEERAALDSVTSLKLSLLGELSTREDGKRNNLCNSLDKVTANLTAINNFITDKYFDHREPSQQLVQGDWENSE